MFHFIHGRQKSADTILLIIFEPSVSRVLSASPL
ncbi:hypothetical protein T08_15760 [Trichinella sp. T8]|nr:hypothetical protein T08_15760 [Trichinella sp. T8]